MNMPPNDLDLDHVQPTDYSQRMKLPAKPGFFEHRTWTLGTTPTLPMLRVLDRDTVRGLDVKQSVLHLWRRDRLIAYRILAP